MDVHFWHSVFADGRGGKGWDNHATPGFHSQAFQDIGQFCGSPRPAGGVKMPQHLRGTDPGRPFMERQISALPSLAPIHADADSVPGFPRYGPALNDLHATAGTSRRQQGGSATHSSYHASSGLPLAKPAQNRGIPGCLAKAIHGR